MGAKEDTLKRPKPASVLESLGALGDKSPLIAASL